MTTDKEVLHTQVKWVQCGETITVTDHLNFTCFVNPNGNYNAGIPSIQDRATAELICKAVNNYQTLLDSNRELTEYANYVRETIESREEPFTFGVWKSYNKKETGWQTGPYGILD